MNFLKKMLNDPALWSLIVMNLFFVNYFENHPNSFKTHLWLYWLQSVLIGVFNFFALLTLKKLDAFPVTVNGKEIDVSKQKNGCIAFFFLVHYGIFHLVYFVFLATGFKEYGSIDTSLFKYGIVILFINQIISFVQSKSREKENPSNVVGKLFTPYLRIIPMHLTILLPTFFNFSSIHIFIILKTIADVIMHLITTGWYWNKEEKRVGDIANTDML